MYTIKTIDNISQIGLSQLPSDKYNIVKDAHDADAILVRSSSLHQMVVPKNLKIIGRAGAGVNNIPVAELTKQGIPVLNTPGANANAVKELVLTGMLLASRNICQAWQFVTQLTGDDESISAQIEKNKKQFVGHELAGKTLGVIGLGYIGVKVANAALALGMNVLGFDPGITVKRALELSSSVQQADSLQDLLSHSSFISLHVPLVEETKHLINAERLKQIKSETVLLNFSRENIVDQSALIEELNEHHLSAYVTDFPTNKIYNHPRVIALPHLGASTKEAEENCAVMIVKQIRDFLEYGSIRNSVNFPDVNLPFHGGHRLAIVNANVPNMVAQISIDLAKAGHNILNLINQSRGEVAYTLLDVDQAISEQTLKEIAEIKGVMKVRKIAIQKS